MKYAITHYGLSFITSTDYAINPLCFQVHLVLTFVFNKHGNTSRRLHVTGARVETMGFIQWLSGKLRGGMACILIILQQLTVDKGLSMLH